VAVLNCVLRAAFGSQISLLEVGVSSLHVQSRDVAGFAQHALLLTGSHWILLLLCVQAEIGVDAGAYARLLMVHAKEAADAAADDVAAGTLSAQAILESAFYRTNVQGASCRPPACIWAAQ
jgi:hypothetical protein